MSSRSQINRVVSSEISPINKALISINTKLKYIEDFGAKGDYNPDADIGTDDTQAFKDAFWWMELNQLPVFLVPGKKYLVTDTLDIEFHHNGIFCEVPFGADIYFRNTIQYKPLLNFNLCSTYNSFKNINLRDIHPHTSVAIRITSLPRTWKTIIQYNNPPIGTSVQLNYYSDYVFTRASTTNVSTKTFADAQGLVDCINANCIITHRIATATLKDGYVVIKVEQTDRYQDMAQAIITGTAISYFKIIYGTNEPNWKNNYAYSKVDSFWAGVAFDTDGDRKDYTKQDWASENRFDHFKFWNCKHSAINYNSQAYNNTFNDCDAECVHENCFYFNGSIDDFRIYNTELSGSDVNNLCNGNTISTSPIVLYAINEYGSTLVDTSGNSKDGTFKSMDDLGNIATITPPKVSGKNGLCAILNGTSYYASLPSGIVNGLTNFTITTWIKPFKLKADDRIFDFGIDKNTYMYLTAKSRDGFMRFGITTNGQYNEITCDATTVVPADHNWHHIAITLNGNNMILYIDGIAVGSTSTMTLNPSSLGNTTSNFIGKSQILDIRDDWSHVRMESGGAINWMNGSVIGAGKIFDYFYPIDATISLFLTSKFTMHGSKIEVRGKTTGTTAHYGVLFDEISPKNPQLQIMELDIKNLTMTLNGQAIDLIRARHHWIARFDGIKGYSGQLFVRQYPNTYMNNYVVGAKGGIVVQNSTANIFLVESSSPIYQGEYSKGYTIPCKIINPIFDYSGASYAYDMGFKMYLGGPQQVFGLNIGQAEQMSIVFSDHNPMWGFDDAKFSLAYNAKPTKFKIHKYPIITAEDVGYDLYIVKDPWYWFWTGRNIAGTTPNTVLIKTPSSTVPSTDINIDIQKQSTNNTPLSIVVNTSPKSISIKLATDVNGNITTTLQQLVDALNANTDFVNGLYIAELESSTTVGTTICSTTGGKLLNHYGGRIFDYQRDSLKVASIPSTVNKAGYFESNIVLDSANEISCTYPNTIKYGTPEINDTITINGVTFTCSATTDISNKKFSDAAGLSSCISANCIGVSSSISVYALDVIMLSAITITASKSSTNGFIISTGSHVPLISVGGLLKVNDPWNGTWQWREGRVFAKKTGTSTKKFQGILEVEYI